jgi:hypothetical protein
MESMFNGTAYNSTNFVLNLGDKFNVNKVTKHVDAFYITGYSTPNFKPKATVKTQAEKDAILAKFPIIDITIKP